jgi:hypothetical protein
MNDHAQSGQAVVEGLVILGVLASLWLGAAWLGRLQDVALQAGHTSRHMAFALAHQGQTLELLHDGNHGSSAPTPHSRHGEAFLDAAAARLSWVRDGRVPALRIGDADPMAEPMRQDLRLGDAGVWSAHAHRRAAGVSTPDIGLREFDRYSLGISRHTAIMQGSGAATGDAAVQERIAQADSVWAGVARHSTDLGERTSGRVQALDEAWGRARFTPDWLAPWTGWVPAYHLSKGGTP